MTTGYAVVLIDKQNDLLESAGKQFSTLEMAYKGPQALKTINQKIATLPSPMANQVRQASRDLLEAMKGPRRIQAIKDIPDEVWEEAEAKDEFDDKPDV